MKVHEQKIAEGEEDEVVFKLGLQLKRQLNNYEEIIEKLDRLLKGKELADRNKKIESEKKEEKLKNAEVIQRRKTV